MNLEKIKELEDLKSEMRKYGSQYQSLFDNKIHEYIVNVHKDFANYFKNKGFTINETSKEIQVMYGGSKIKIDKYNCDEEPYFGFYAVWEMECQINKSNYRIVLNEFGHYPSMSSTFVSKKILTEEEKINKEIEEIKEKIENKKKDISEFSNFKFGYGLIDKNQNNRNDRYPYFESISQLLDSIFN